MLNKGFSLFEMLLALVITSLLIICITRFYSQFHIEVSLKLQRDRLEEATHQALSGLIKDIKRAGYIANSPATIVQPAIEIDSSGTCIIIRYDSVSSGRWRYEMHEPQLSDVFAYRYTKHNLESQTGVLNCKSSSTRWEKLFDPNEIIITKFKLKKQLYYTELHIAVVSKRTSAINYQVNYYIKNENR